MVSKSRQHDERTQNQDEDEGRERHVRDADAEPLDDVVQRLEEQRVVAHRVPIRDDLPRAAEHERRRVLRLRLDRKSTRLNSSHSGESRMPSSA